MLNTRRNFFSQLGFVCAGASGLLIPSTAMAFGRRRRAASPCPQPIVQAGAPIHPRLFYDDVSMSYPNSTLTAVPLANGAFLCWGIRGAGININPQTPEGGLPIGFQLTTGGLGGTAVATTAAAVTVPSPPNTYSWGYVVSGMSAGTQFGILISYTFQLSTGGMGTGQINFPGPYTT